MLTIFVLTACGPTPPEVTREYSNESPYYPNAPVEYDADIYGFQGLDLSADGKVLFTENVSSGYTFILANAPGFLFVNAATGELTGNPSEGGLTEDITIRAINTGNGSIINKQFDLAVNGDPLRTQMWALNNTGQKSFANSSGVVGVDINAFEAWNRGIKGSGIKVAVSDSGVEINHDDLFQNSLSGEHRDYSLNSPYLGSPVATSFHGTAVTGIIAAKGWNNIGLTGVAPEAKFAGFQFLDSPQSSSVLVHQASGDFDIFNYSYGDTLYYDTLSDSTYIAHLRYSTQTLSKVFVKAAGNEHLLSQGSLCAPHNANLPYENESPFIIVVGSVNADGVKSTFSNTGSNLWVSAPGGEYGISQPAIISTDLPTCLKGKSKAQSTIYNSFEYGHSLNQECHYTSTMNATSAATPHVSGVIALMLEANPSLKMRDVKHILASTSTRVNSTHTNNYFGVNHPSNVLSGCSSLNLAGHDYELGWVKNDADYWYNNFYGFGMVDADAAVAAAVAYGANLPALIELNPNLNSGTYRSVSGNSIPDFNGAGVTDTLTVAANHTIESVQIKVRIEHPASGEVGFELISPDGTRSVILNINNSLLFDDDEDLNVVLTTHAFYGENSAGNWTLKAFDGKSGNTGTLTEWYINILGH